MLFRSSRQRARRGRRRRGSRSRWRVFSTSRGGRKTASVGQEKMASSYGGKAGGYLRKRLKWQASWPGDWAVATEPDRTASARWKKKSRIMRPSCHREDERKMSVADYFSRCSDMWSTPPPSNFALSLSPKATAQLLAMDRPMPAEKRGAVESEMTIYALKKMCVSPTCARPLPQQKLQPTTRHE